MKLKKRFISALMTVCMCFTLFTPSAFAANDYTGHWAEESIQRVIDDGWTHEGATESYRPNEYITRAEFIDMINNMMGYTGTGNMSEVTDVNADDWYYESFSIAIANGYIAGYGDGSLRPNDPITRAQAFSIFSRISEFNTAKDNSPLAEGIADWDTVPDWGRDSVLAAIAEGFVSGNGDGTIAGDQFITRAESASLLSNKKDNVRTFAIPGQYMPTNAGSVIVSGSDITVEVPANTQLSTARVAPNSVNAHIIIHEGGHVADLSVERGATGTVIDVEGGTTVDTATINGPTDLSVKNGSTLNTLNVGTGADGTKVATEEGSNINTANISTPAEISGGGSIGSANIKSNGVVVESKPGTTEVDRGLSANVGSETVRGSTPSSSNSGRSSSGGSSSSGNNSGGNQTNYGRVTFNSNGGSTVASVRVVLGRVLSQPADPTKEGYTFEGWYSDIDLNTAWNFTTGVVRRNITLYAKWTENAPTETKWTVTFDLNDGSAVSTVEVVEGDPVSKPKEPTREGYTFEGWYEDKELTDLWDFATGVTKDITLFAKWDIAQMTGITLSKTSEVLTVGGSPIALAVTFMPEGAAYDNIAWESSDETYVTVEDGSNETEVYVTALDETPDGVPVVITVTVTAGGKPFTAACEITVTDEIVPVTNVEITSGSSLTVVFGQADDFGGVLGAKYTPEDATNVNLVWESDDTEVVSVGETSGELTIYKAGTVTITLTVTDALSNTFSASIEITAIKAGSGEPEPGEASGLNGVYEITADNVPDEGVLNDGSAVLVKSGDMYTLYYQNDGEEMGSLVLDDADAALLAAITTAGGVAVTNKATFDASNGVTEIKAIEIVDSGDGSVDLSALDLSEVSVTLSGGGLDLPGDKTEFTLAGAALLSALENDGTDSAIELTPELNKGVTVTIDQTGKLTIGSAPGTLTDGDPTVYAGENPWKALYSIEITVDEVTAD